MTTPLKSIGPLLPVLRQKPLAIFSDIDGTISPIAPHPEQAIVPPSIVQALKALLEQGALVVMVSGRHLQQARRMVGIENAVYVGNHGLSVWEGGQEETVDTATAEFLYPARSALEELAELKIPGLVLEDKGPVIAVHYRQTPDKETARHQILAAINASSSAQSFQVHEGRMVIELRPALAVSKGTIIPQLVKRHSLRGLVCLGDDLTDVDMFRAASELTDIATACVAVTSPETSPKVTKSADYSVEGVSGVSWLLDQICRTIT